MTDRPPGTTSTDALKASLARAREALSQINEALAITYEAFASKGLKPSYHLGRAQSSLNEQLGVVEEASQRVIVQLERLNELVHTTALITSTLELDQVLEEVMDTVIQLTGAERAYLMLYNDSKELEVRAARNWDQKTLSGEGIGLSKSVVDAAIESGQPILTTNAQADDRFAHRESIVVQRLRSIICIPLTMAGKLAGVLYADNRYTEDVFGQDVIPILTAFGTQAAIAITNAHTFGQVREELWEAQKVIQQLRIEINQSSVDQQVSQITDTSYFKELAEAAKEMRRRKKQPSDRSSA
jgi:transcriptional regulator with GAF, ATPase, and Fis domain